MHLRSCLLECFSDALDLCGAKVIKDSMDKKFGFPWHVIVGKYFSYEITSEVSPYPGQLLLQRLNG